MAQVICGARISCGFRVDSDYYETKKRFAKGICARCNGPIHIVEDNTEDIIRQAHMLLGGPGAGRLMGLSAQEEEKATP